MANLVYFLQVNNATDLCKELAPILRILGIVILGIKNVVPILLIIMGMIDLAKAVGQKDEGEIKKAQNLLIKRAIAAVIVFLVATLVSVVFTIVGQKQDKACMTCINHPFNKDACPSIENVDESSYN